MRQKQKDYYKILGINSNATSEEIKSAYRQKVFKYHPDRNQGDKEHEDKIKEINEAYEVLSDDFKREQYDHPSPFGNFFNDDFFSNFGTSFDSNAINFGGFTINFGENGFSTHFKKSIQKDIKLGLHISLHEAYCGCKKNINYQRKIYTATNDGRIRASNKNESLLVDIPSKIRKLSTLKLEHMGNKDPNGNTGDLYLIIDYPIEENNHLVQNDGSIICLLNVPIINILREDVIKHTILGDKESVEIKLDASKKNGELYIVKGKGFNNSNFIARVFYDIPIITDKEDRDIMIGVLEKYGK